MKEHLLNYLVCPGCKGSLRCEIFGEDHSLKWTEILEGLLTCTECARTYPVRGGVPRLLVEDLSRDVEETVEGFGWEWSHFNSQILGTYMAEASHFLDFVSPVTADFFTDKLVLDAGCGMGRFLKLGAEFGSDEIIGVDLSQSVDAAYLNTRHLPNAHVVQADIFRLPFSDKFDYIFSIGVLHHMPDPKAGFARLVSHLKNGGRISIWVYAQENNDWIIKFLTPLRRNITSHMPRPALYAISRVIGLVTYLGLKLIYKPANESRWGKKLGGWLPYNDYFYYTSQLDYAGVVSVVFDHLVPQLTEYVSKKELESWFHAEGLSEIAIGLRNKMSWRAHGLNRPDKGRDVARGVSSSSQRLEAPFK